MRIIHKLAISLDRLINDKFVNSSFNYEQATINGKCSYDFLFATKYKLSIMAMDIGLLYKMLEINIDIDKSIFQDELDDLLEEAEQITIKELPNFLHLITKKYANYNESIEHKHEELGVTSEEEKIFAYLILGYIDLNLKLINCLEDSYRVISSLPYLIN